MFVRSSIIRSGGGSGISRGLVSRQSLFLKGGSTMPPRRGIFTDQIADILTATHEYTNIPWLIFIPLTTFTLRTIFTLPLSINQRQRVVKQQELRRVSKSTVPVIKSRLALHVNNNESTTSTTILSPDQINLLSLKESRKRQRILFQKYKVPMWKNMILPLIQIPLWTTLSLSIRSLTRLEIDRSTKTWFDSFNYNGIDLTGPLVDHPLIIPMTLGILSLLNVEYNSHMMTRGVMDNIGIKTYKDEMSRMNRALNSILNISRFGCIFMMGVSSQSAILLSLYWISSQLYSLIQNVILDKMWPYQR